MVLERQQQALQGHGPQLQLQRLAPVKRDHMACLRRLGCTRCVTCSEFGFLPSESISSQEFEEWWPHGIQSPGLYLQLWSHQLACNILQASRRPAGVWRPITDSVAAGPSAMLKRRSLSSLVVQLPTTYTSVAQSDGALQYMAAVRVPLHMGTSSAAPLQPNPFAAWATHRCSNISSSQPFSQPPAAFGAAARGMPAGHFIAPSLLQQGAVPRVSAMRCLGRAVQQQGVGAGLWRYGSATVQPPQPQPQPQLLQPTSSSLTSPAGSARALPSLEVIELHNKAGQPDSARGSLGCFITCKESEATGRVWPLVSSRRASPTSVIQGCMR